MTTTTTAASFLATFRTVYAERMTAAAHVGGAAPVQQMNEARDVLVSRLGFSKLDAANLVRAIHVAFCDDIGHAVPAEYRAGLLRVLETAAA